MAVAAHPVAIVVYAVVNCGDTYVLIVLCSELAVETGQTVAVTVVVAAVGNCGYAAAI